MKTSYVYIITNKKYGTLYTGVTSDLVKRVYEHKNKIKKGFASRYNLDKLVYWQQFEDIMFAIKREKQIKKMLRIEKIKLIDFNNKSWDDLYENIC